MMNLLINIYYIYIYLLCIPLSIILLKKIKQKNNFLLMMNIATLRPLLPKFTGNKLFVLIKKNNNTQTTNIQKTKQHKTNLNEIRQSKQNYITIPEKESQDQNQKIYLN